jgi:non-homologous end joining protein Ku
MLELIQRKVEGEDIASIATEEESEHKIIDMMEALEARLTVGKRDTGATRKPVKRVTTKAGTKSKSPRRS